ncbi:hypothetical protein [Pseudomonas sp. NPDC089569]|uniref:hypothetical protein n=1 Tax=Pseudomonas sp. NPDC089569 TaxID=3390722 RepID=UPI003CFCA7A7
MGQKFAVYDSTGLITGFYDESDSPVPQDANPDAIIQLTDAEWLLCLSVPHGVIDGQLVQTTQNVSYQSGSQYAAKINDLVASVSMNWTRFEGEYVSREAAARAYKAAGYTGECSIWITAFANAAKQTYKASTDLIIQQADGLRAAQEALGALRMRKYEIVPLSGAEARAKYDEICAAITQVASQIS